MDVYTQYVLSSKRPFVPQKMVSNMRSYHNNANRLNLTELTMCAGPPSVLHVCQAIPRSKSRAAHPKSAVARP